MPKKDREKLSVLAYGLHKLKGFSVREIAEVLGVSVGTVHNLVKDGDKLVKEKGVKIDPDTVDEMLSEFMGERAYKTPKPKAVVDPSTASELIKLMAGSPEFKEAMRETLAELIREEFEEEKRESRPKYAEREMEVKEVVTVPRRLNISPRTIQYYHWFISKTGTMMSLEEFIDAVVDEHFRDCLGVEVAIIFRGEKETPHVSSTVKQIRGGL